MRWKRASIPAALLAGCWILAAGFLVGSTTLLEILAWQSLHRGNYADAETLLAAQSALTRTATWIGVPGQRVRLAGCLLDLAEAREQRGAPGDAEELYRESIAIFDADLGPEDSHAREARWRFERFQRSNRDAGGAASHEPFDSQGPEPPPED